MTPRSAAATGEATALDEAACVQRLRQLETLLRNGRPRDALTCSSGLFAEAAIPPGRVGELCALTAEAAQALGLVELAEQMWRQAAAHAASPSSRADAFANLGALLARQRRHAEAEACDRRALELAPDHVVALANLAVLLADTGQRDEAETCHRQALALAPDNAAVHSNLGVLLAASKRPAEAELHYRRALELAPDSASAHTNLGLLLQEQRQFDAAEAHQRRALALAPDSAEIHSNLGNLLARRGREDEAEALLRRALVLDPEWAAAHNNLGVLLADQWRDDAAEHHFRRALALRPDYPLARLDLGCLLLAQGRFDEGWRLHEARHDPALPDNGIARPDLALPAWQGESLAGRALLVWPEQGLGDQIQFCRYVPRLKALGAARITLVCQRPLQALFETLAGVDAVVGADIVDNAFAVDPAAIGTHDCWTFPLSLPALLRTDLASLPEVELPYLRAPPQRVAEWERRQRDAGDGNDDGLMRIGLVWRGNPRHDNDAERSLPGLATLAPLWQLPGLRFVSLQAGRAGIEASAAPPGQPLRHVGAALRDFADTAAALAAIDLLICVDTSIAHLAGALGTPCWVLLPQHRTDWRWLRGRDDSPWYPLGMRLFRQTQRGDWAAVIERVCAALQTWAPADRRGSVPLRPASA